MPIRDARFGKRPARPATGHSSSAIADVWAPSWNAIAAAISASAPSSAANTHSSGRANRGAARWMPENSSIPAAAGSSPSWPSMNGTPAAITTISVRMIAVLARTRRPWRSMKRARSNWLRQIQEGRISSSGRMTTVIGRNRRRARPERPGADG